jgi:secreted trypsin-like serine protease
MFNFSRSALLAIAIFYPVLSNAIIIRHDADDNDYKALAATFNSTVSFFAKYEGKRVAEGTGTVIRNDWVLTAAHVANILKIGDEVSVAGKIQKIQQIIIHPNWADRKFPNDVALVRIENTPSSITIAQLYERTDEAGKISTFIGRGDFGNGVSGVLNGDGEKRAAHNKVETASSQWLRYMFDRGEKALPLEGISGPGDSGGPAFVLHEGKLFIIGISSWQNTEETNWLEARYGVVENYSRVSFHFGWIEAIVDSNSVIKNDTVKSKF